MFATAIIVFREVLEAAILIGILAAATRAVPGRTRWLLGGIIAGLAAAGLVATFTERIANAVSGVGQEIFNAIVLATAVVMLAWHNLWMSTHGASLAADARSVGNQIREGRSERSVLLLVVGLAVLREGAETVLFLFGVATSSETGATGMVGGGLAGLLAGVLTGYALYAGLLRIPLHHLFNATSILVLLIAAGMASQATRFLIQADMLPSLAAPLWDTSSVVSPSSVTGVLLHGFIGYDARPAGMQIVVYLIVLISIGLGMRYISRSQRKTHAARTNA
jgi:high-affinity iron transporter